MVAQAPWKHASAGRGGGRAHGVRSLWEEVRKLREAHGGDCKGPMEGRRKLYDVGTAMGVLHVKVAHHAMRG